MKNWSTSLVIVATLALAGVLVSTLDHRPIREARRTVTEQTPSIDPQRACEAEVTRSLTRTAFWLDQGVSVDQVVAQEHATLSPRAYSAFSFVLNDFVVQRSRREGVTNQITAVMPDVRRIC